MDWRTLERVPPARKWGGAVFGALATLVLHVLLFAPILWGTASYKRHVPSTQGAAASRNLASHTEALAVVFIDESTAIQEVRDTIDDLAVRLQVPLKLFSPISKPAVSMATDPDQWIELKDDPATAEANGDQSRHAMMFGRYVGQISARIQRAWIRSRTPVEAGVFACRVQILQDHSGMVQEITVQQCNGGLRWQESLVQAIQSASPLPAPPDPAVFSNLLTLEFDSEPFVLGTSDEGFESG